MKPANYAPVYAGLYPQLAEIARRHGYAMAVHGSMARDADLICIPWTDKATEPQAVVDAITTEFVIRNIGEPSVREHGRIVYTLTVSAPGCFIDLSFTPLQTAPEPQGEEDDVVSRLKREAAHMRADRHFKAAYAMEGAIALLTRPQPVASPVTPEQRKAVHVILAEMQHGFLDRQIEQYAERIIHALQAALSSAPEKP